MRRIRSSSPPPPPPAAALATLPDGDDILVEILLRLPPQPSSLPRASLVCKRWLRLLSDPWFHRRFRAFHRRNPQLLGFFVGGIDDGLHFMPTVDPPDRIPSTRLSRTPQHRGERCSFLCCRHCLALLLNRTRLEVTVWDPVTRDQRRVAVPPENSNSEGPKFVRHGALLYEDGRCHSKPSR
ncbi:F-box protein At5g03970 [Panicum virgatum]|uniref:F-box protein At5g03970 n=1 Tax=Panicum virgatum TaxID=38727 RepID=UPI0019D60377|nr:F-box protein At5g03970 [Panicum virgatum]